MTQRKNAKEPFFAKRKKVLFGVFLGVCGVLAVSAGHWVLRAARSATTARSSASVPGP